MDMKEKFKKIGKISYVVLTTILSILFIIICIIGGVQNANKQPSKQLKEDSINEVYSFKYDNKKYVSVNSDNYSVEIHEFDNGYYFWFHLRESLYDAGYVGYENHLVVSNSSYVVGSSNDSHTIYGLFCGTFDKYDSIVFEDGSGNIITILIDSGLDYVQFNATNSLTNLSTFKMVIVSEDFYNVVANIDYPMNEGIFDTLTGGVNGFIGSLNSGIQSMTSVFYNDGLTTIGLLSVIVVAISFAYFLFRLIIGLIRMRG